MAAPALREQQPHTPLALQLLQRTARLLPAHHERNERRMGVGDAPDVELRWLLSGGLGPLLYWAMRQSERDLLPAATRELLLSTDLAAQLKHARLVQATAELIDLCRDIEVPVVLLKGISVSEQYYPAGHLRPMGDVDVLIPRSAYDRVERAMFARGYRRMLDDDSMHDQTLHHGIPLFLPDHAVWMELHTGLFPEHSPLRRDALFGPTQLSAHCVCSTFQGREVQRLSDELQLVYAAAGWVRDLQSQDIHPSFLPPVFDAIHLLHAAGRFDWDKLFSMLDNQMAAASLYMLLGYLDRHRLSAVPAAMLSRLRVAQPLVGPLELRIFHTLLDRHLVAGRPIGLFQSWHLFANLMTLGAAPLKLLRLPWNVMFPPGTPDRYRPAYQVPRLSRCLRELVRAGRRAHEGDVRGKD